MKTGLLIKELAEETKLLNEVQAAKPELKLIHGGKPSYTALVLYERDRNMLVSTFADCIPEGWEKIAHHVTVNLGSWKGDREMLGKDCQISIEGCYKNELVSAAKVWVDQSLFSVANPHITIAVNREAGGKPAMAGKLDFTQQAVNDKKGVVFGKLVEVMLGDNKYAEEY